MLDELYFFRKCFKHERACVRRNEMIEMAKNTICLWYDGDAEEAARYG